MNIRPVDLSSPRSVDEFVRLPYRLYANNPYWVPPLLSDERAILDTGRHPFYRHSTAAFFIAEQRGEIVGRIAVANNRNYNRHCDSRVALINAFEAQDDPAIAAALFAAAFDWARSQVLTEVQGPKGFLHLGGRGLLVEGFDRPPAMGNGYHFPYYAQFFADAGLHKVTDYLSGQLDATYQLPERYLEIAERVRRRRHLWTKCFQSKREIREWVPRFLQVYNQSFVNVPGFYPMTNEEMHLVADSLLAITFPSLVKLIMKEDRPVGFMLSYPNVNAALKKARGRLLPLGWFHLWRERRRTRTVDFNGIGLLPEHQGVGATAILYSELAHTVHQFGYQHANLVQVSDLNQKSLRELQNFGAEIVVRHRLYRRAL